MSPPTWSALQPGIQSYYEKHSLRDYSKFARWLEQLQKGGQITEKDRVDILARFPDPRPRGVTKPDDEDAEEVFLSDPPDPGPLAAIAERGWITDAIAKKLRYKIENLSQTIDVPDLDVVHDVQENSLHILGRSENPTKWKENRAGLVYGMVQSGKTASMITVTALARKAGYRLFILLAGDKSSLRDQTQDRVNAAFRLENGVNKDEKIHSPTWRNDLVQTNTGYMESFRFRERIQFKQDWATILVVKKNKDQLHDLAAQLKHLQAAVKDAGRDFDETFPAIVFDDEADYGSPNTSPDTTGSPIHNDIVAIRDALPRNTYIAYTATPQACLSGDPADPVGYPKDFSWLLEPYMDKKDRGYVPRSYLGAWDVFWEYDSWLLHRVPRNEWPHYEKDARGKKLGIYVPPLRADQQGTHELEGGRIELETAFLEDVLNNRRLEVASLTNALIDYMIGCGLTWYRHWRQEGDREQPSLDRIEREYPFFAAMVHLSETQNNQDRIRRVVQAQWGKAVAARESFSPTRSPQEHPFRQRWRLQEERTRDLRNETLPSYKELKWFIDRCIELTSRPIRDPSDPAYPTYAGNPFVYMLNAGEDGNELAYGDQVDPEIQTKRASIIVGGNILSRGLTIKGLSVTVFGRAAEMPLGDAMLQMGRWFGHKRSSIDVISIFLQDGIRNIMAQVAEADRNLRLQIKSALYDGLGPMEVLLQLKNSPFFRITSRNKTRFLDKDVEGIGFSGKSAALNQPSFDVDDIVANLKAIERFQDLREGELVHDRARLCKNVPVRDIIKLLRELRCDKDALPVSYSLYADYLERWSSPESASRLPKINVAVWEKPQRRQRIMNTTKPTSAEEARASVTDRFGPIVGGQSEDGSYKGDAFLDKDDAWHRRAKNPSRNRAAGDDILIVFYLLDPNYVTKRIFDPTGKDSSGSIGRWKNAEVRLQKGDRYFVEKAGKGAEDLSVMTFAAWTPLGGPMYSTYSNRLVWEAGKVRRRGRDRLDEVAPVAE